MKYVPILRSKAGEHEALNRLHNHVKSQMAPLIQLAPDNSDRRVGDFVLRQIDCISKAWAFANNTLYLDPQHLGGENVTMCEQFFSGLKAKGINVIPVIRPTTSRLLLASMKAYVTDGACIRLSGDHMDPNISNQQLPVLYNFLGLTEGNVDLLIDFEFTTPANVPHYANSFANLFLNLKNATVYRNVIIGSGSFPDTLSNITAGTISTQPRSEWALWNSIRDRFPSGAFIYADYANVNPNFGPLQRGYEPSCSIKYTDTDNYIIFRGRQASGTAGGRGQYHEKSRELIAHSSYSGRDFSWGDNYVYECSQRSDKPGAPVTWVSVTQNHHFTKIVSTLS